ncbi:hypothetical protein AGR1A_pAt20295 [Agrobacterium fabacearum CFBP 5771]|nr:hypothetical protein AGR1A_pAt20295 [Agrobacterium fabacearum CFBP 5771]
MAVAGIAVAQEAIPYFGKDDHYP